jgi:hypothetical protein
MLWMGDYLEDGSNISFDMCANVLESRHDFMMQTNSRLATSDFESQIEQEPLRNLVNSGIIYTTVHVNNE